MPFPEITPQKLDNPFTITEIENAIKSLKNNKSRGCNILRAEHEYAPKEIKEELLNIIDETGEYPKEIKLGQLTPLQKPGNPKGPAENLRAVILLSTLRKLLAICLIKRISNVVGILIETASKSCRISEMFAWCLGP